jgi:endonuclease/exonuclease/phosphatase family metal-dependent hydrolase
MHLTRFPFFLAVALSLSGVSACTSTKPAPGGDAAAASAPSAPAAPIASSATPAKVKPATISQQETDANKFLTATIAFYNLENLYDAEDDPKIDDETFLPTSPLKWDDARYRTKLANMASVINELGDVEGPDVLGVTEVENRRVLDELVKQPAIAARKYQIVHFDSPDPRGIDVALLYKPDHFTLTSQRAVPVALPDTTMGTRDILVVEGKLNGDPITFLVCHWPSRRNGQKSDKRRFSVAAQSRRLIDEHLRTNPQARILLMGDLNDSPTDSSVVSILHASKELRNLPKGQLHNAFYDLQAQGKGTLFYRGRPDVFDQMVLSGGLCNGSGLHYRAGSARIYAPERLTTPEVKFAGEPLRTYGGKRYLGGYSDHFPIYLMLTK